MATRHSVYDAGNSGSSARSQLDDARRAAGDHRWRDAYEILSRIDGEMALGVEDLESLSTAAFLCGERDECRQARLRAYHIHLTSGDVRRAARCAVRIGLEQLDTAEIARASGCLPASLSSCSSWAGRASALLGGEDECAEHGYPLVAMAYERLLSADDDLGECVELTEQAVEIGRRFGDDDLVALAQMIEGRALVRSQGMHHGMPVLEESVSSVGTGGLSVPVAGIVLTGAVDVAAKTLDLERFDQWSQLLVEWAELHGGIVLFRSRSLLYRTISSRIHGRWGEALELSQAATDPAISGADLAAAAEASYERGEILRLRGQPAAAEAAFREASRLGRDPAPGLGLLRLNDDVDAAAASTARAIAESDDRLVRASLLPAHVEILIEAGDLESAAEAVEELEVTAGIHGSPLMEAAAYQSRARLRMSRDDWLGSVTALRQASRVWRHFEVPYEEGRARALMARCFQRLGDHETADLEMEAAGRLFTRLGAEPGLMGMESLRPASSSDTHGLTSRELEVLRLVARGLTNGAIADELVVAVRTVDSHVRNVFAKLGVSNRASATAYAYRKRLV